VTPIGWLRHGPAPGVLLVTPAIAVATPAVFAAHAAGHRDAGAAARLASDHLAGELRTGLRARDLLARAAVLAGANDLATPATVVEPGLVPFRRALRRLLGRPVGQSGSGPTHWALYPSRDDAEEAVALVRDAAADGRLPTIGDAPPFVAATTVLAADRPDATPGGATP
jgi:4-diphosphocytidyl-2C-methyl-D-erythritol kinase